jgi:hypothetical protein
VSNSLLLRSKNHRKLAENTLAISFHLCIAPKTSETQRQRENSSKNSELRFNDFLLQRQKNHTVFSSFLSSDSSPTPSEFFVSTGTSFSQKKKKDLQTPQSSSLHAVLYNKQIQRTYKLVKPAKKSQTDTASWKNLLSKQQKQPASNQHRDRERERERERENTHKTSSLSTNSSKKTKKTFK